MSTSLERIRQAALEKVKPQFRKQVVDGKELVITTRDDDAMASARPGPMELECVVPGTSVFDWHRHEARWELIVDMVTGFQYDPTTMTLAPREQAEFSRLQTVASRFALGTGRGPRGQKVDNTWRSDPAAIKIKLMAEGMHTRPDVVARRGLGASRRVLDSMGFETSHLPEVGAGPTRGGSFREKYNLLTDGGKKDPTMAALFEGQPAPNIANPAGDGGEALRSKVPNPGGEFVEDRSSRRRTIRRYDMEGTRVVRPDEPEAEVAGDLLLEDKPRIQADVIKPSLADLKSKTPPGETENLIEISVDVSPNGRALPPRPNDLRRLLLG